MEVAQETDTIKFPKPADDLLHKLETLKAIVCTQRLLWEGSFRLQETENLQKSLNYINAMYKVVLDEALAHPDSHLIADLEALRPKKEA